MNDLDSNGVIDISKEELKTASNIFSSGKAAMNDVNAVINQVFSESGYLIDPHTAVGLHASRQHNDNSHLNCILATASPVKFSETVERATSKNLNLLEGYDSLFESSEKYVELSNSIDEVKEQILTKNS
jgi:threonine synthase